MASHYPYFVLNADQHPILRYLSARRDPGEEHEDCGDGGGDVEEREQGAVLRFLAHGRHYDLRFLWELTSPMTCCIQVR